MSEKKYPTDSYNESDLHCPYCGASQMDAVYDGCAPKPGYDFEGWDCSGCDKKFLVNTEVVFNYKRDCAVNGLEHEFVDDDPLGLYQQDGWKHETCKNCPAYKMERI